MAFLLFAWKVGLGKEEDKVIPKPELCGDKTGMVTWEIPGSMLEEGEPCKVKEIHNRGTVTKSAKEGLAPVKLSAIYLKADFCAGAGRPQPLFQCFLWCDTSSSHGDETNWEQYLGIRRLRNHRLLCSNLTMYTWRRFLSSPGLSGLIFKMSGWTTSPRTLLRSLIFWAWLGPSLKVT